MFSSLSFDFCLFGVPSKEEVLQKRMESKQKINGNNYDIWVYDNRIYQIKTKDGFQVFATPDENRAKQKMSELEKIV